MSMGPPTTWKCAHTATGSTDTKSAGGTITYPDGSTRKLCKAHKSLLIDKYDQVVKDIWMAMGKTFEPGWLTDFSEEKTQDPADPNEIRVFCYSGHKHAGTVRRHVDRMNEMRVDRWACERWQDLAEGVTCTVVSSPT